MRRQSILQPDQSDPITYLVFMFRDYLGLSKILFVFKHIYPPDTKR